MIYPSINSNVFVAKVYAVNTCTLVSYADIMNSRAYAKSSLSLDKAFRTELCIRASCGYVCNYIESNVHNVCAHKYIFTHLQLLPQTLLVF